MTAADASKYVCMYERVNIKISLTDDCEGVVSNRVGEKNSTFLVVYEILRGIINFSMDWSFKDKTQLWFYFNDNES